MTAIYERKQCFLTLPEWRDIAFDKTELDFDDCLNTDLVRYMAELPSILRDLKDLDNQFAGLPIDEVLPFDMTGNSTGDEALSDTSCCPSLDYSPNNYDNLDFLNDLHPVEVTYPTEAPQSSLSPARLALLSRVQSLKDSLYELGIHLNEKLANGSTAVEVPSIEENSPVSTTYHFTSWRDMTGYSCFWSMLILMNKVMMRLLPPFDPIIYSLRAECQSVAHEICKTWEDAWESKPIGALHTGLSFVVAYEFCKPNAQDWILGSMNSLLEYQMVDAFRWSDEVIAMMSGKLAGEGPDLVFSNVGVSKETQ